MKKNSGRYLSVYVTRESVGGGGGRHQASKQSSTVGLFVEKNKFLCYYTNNVGSSGLRTIEETHT